MHVSRIPLLVTVLFFGLAFSAMTQLLANLQLAEHLIHFFQSGSIEIPTIGSIAPAGNLWVANNWNSVEGATSLDSSRPTSTWGGGSGFTVIYEVAAPLKTPLMGQVRTY
jgi:hypothetical protein